MSVNQCKEAIKSLIDATDDETLLEHWKRRLEHDIKNTDAAELSEEEWSLVQEGIADYNAGHVMSLEEFISKRK